jgi:hypothetical protein
VPAQCLRAVFAASLFHSSAGVTCAELPNCGWHMSFFGGARAIKEKLRSYSHQEWNTPDIVRSFVMCQCCRRCHVIPPSAFGACQCRSQHAQPRHTVSLAPHAVQRADSSCR